jgi:Concanavalin A-like lectin/glucanases superfamily
MKKLMMLIVVALLFAGSASADLIGYWDFNEGAGTVANNSVYSGIKGDAYLKNSAGWSTNTSTGSGYSLDLSDVSGDWAEVTLFYAENDPNNYLEAAIGQTYFQIPETDVTWEYMMYAMDGPPATYFGIPWESYGNMQTQYLQRDDQSAGYVRGWNYNWPTASTAVHGWPDHTIPHNEWHHVALVWEKDIETLSLWIDGQLAMSTASTNQHGAAYSMAFGASRSGGDGVTENYVGLIDEAKIWNEARFSVVPEPSMMGIALLALLRRKRK